jgi:hypothetical protein
MASALDAILDHIQKDPMAKHLFHDDDSETSTIIENPLPITQSIQVNAEKTAAPENDVQMQIKEIRGTKQQHSIESPKIRHGPDPNVQTSPNRSPPPKKRPEPNMQPSANPDNAIGSGGNSNVAY